MVWSISSLNLIKNLAIPSNHILVELAVFILRSSTGFFLFCFGVKTHRWHYKQVITCLQVYVSTVLCSLLNGNSNFFLLIKEKGPCLFDSQLSPRWNCLNGKLPVVKLCITTCFLYFSVQCCNKAVILIFQITLRVLPCAFECLLHCFWVFRFITWER